MSAPISASQLKASDLKAFDMAAAGHAGVLSDASGALVIKPCTAAEVTFYEISRASYPEFAAHMPVFYGTLQVADQQDGAEQAAAAAEPLKHNRNTNIVLSNLAYGFRKPCVLDVKLGAQLWDDAASLEKRARLDAVSNATTSRTLGMRVAGMKVYKGLGAPETNDEGYRVFDKFYGRTPAITENVMTAIREYFNSEISAEHVGIVASRFLETVRDIRRIMEGQESRMYSASLLFAYEGDKAAIEAALVLEKERARKAAEKAAERAAKGETQDDDEDEDEDEEDDDKAAIGKVQDLKLIDFAHATWTPGLGSDENALQGVRSMEKLLAELAGASV